MKKYYSFIGLSTNNGRARRGLRKWRKIGIRNKRCEAKEAIFAFIDYCGGVYARDKH